MQKLSRMQQKVYDYLAAFITERGYPPSVREIGEALDLRSPSTVHFHLKHLAELGYIEKDAGKGRAITLTRIAPAAAPKAAAPEPLEDAQPRRDQIPVLGHVAAGSPILAEECVEDYLTFDTRGREGEYFALRVRGYSMKNAGILPDDLVVVHRQSTAQNGEIVVALLGEEATVKRLKRQNGRVWLMPENEEFSPIDGTEAQLMGRVTAVVRQY
ncbi:MAG: transcriptional repressor LexA [Oscillospiraceae bacterium]